MTIRCRCGHDSASLDYCDECGAPLRLPPSTPDARLSDGGEAVTEEVTQPSRPRPTEPCPRCGTPRVDGGRYCEVDGYDFTAAAPTRWSAEVGADRRYYEALAPDGVAFPVDYTPRSFPLEADEILIGRRATSPATPMIDLAGSPEDEAISRRHAVIRRAADGSYTVADCGSTNGTSLNLSFTRLEPHVAVPLADGDRIHLGAWTTITIRTS